MKISDVDLYIHRDKIVLGRKNKRNQLKSDYIDVTERVVEFLIKRFEVEDGEFIQLKRGDDHYSLEFKKMSVDDVQRINDRDRRESINKRTELSTLIHFITSQSTIL